MRGRSVWPARSLSAAGVRCDGVRERASRGRKAALKKESCSERASRRTSGAAKGKIAGGPISRRREAAAGGGPGEVGGGCIADRSGYSHSSMHCEYI